MSRAFSEQERIRRQSREAMEDRGIQPYPWSWEVNAWASVILDDFDDDLNQPGADGEPARRPMEVSIAGRMMSRRIMGKASFFHLQDDSGLIQVYVRKDDLPADFYEEVFRHHLDIGDILGVEGTAFRTKMGEVSVHARKVVLLSKALRPLPIEKEADGQVFNVVRDKEFRYRQRYVDLAMHPHVRDVFRMRAQMITAIRSFLNNWGYVEVETPVLQPVYGGATARPFTTHHNALDMQLYLRIADELYLKRLLVGGFEGVYEIAKDFRNEGLSRFHNPEFTMMELYVAYKDYLWMMDLVEEMIEQVVLSLHRSTEIPVGEHTISFKRPWKRVCLLDAIKEKVGTDIRGMSRDELAAVCVNMGLEVDPSMGAGKLIDELFGTFVEPELIQPTFVMDYPVELSPLAKSHRSEEGLVERFEMICNGKEICNAFSELNDPDDQRRRFDDQVRLGKGGDVEAMQMDEDYLRALEYGMPPTAGLGVGIDRLAMIMTNQPSIRDVILFPLMRPEGEDTDEA